MMGVDREQLDSIGKKLGERLHKLKLPRETALMEVCGTHTHSLFACGIRYLLPRELKLLSGPGCPVCVTSPGYVDLALKLAGRQDIIIATFGDMVRVPGSSGSLQEAKAGGANIEVVSSGLDVLVLAKRHPMKKIVFLAVGFETTAPTVAATILRTAGSGLKNLTFLAALKLMPGVLRTLLKDSEISIHGLILPGHVCTITGSRAFDFIAEEFKLPTVIAGFQPVEMLAAVLKLAALAEKNKPVPVNLYRSVVTEYGSPQAIALMNKVFNRQEATWRGIGSIPASGLVIKPELAHLDAHRVYGLVEKQTAGQAGCRCGEIIKGKETPPQCTLFKTACRPEKPLGPCMVSSEGTCSAYYKYSLD